MFVPSDFEDFKVISVRNIAGSRGIEVSFRKIIDLISLDHCCDSIYKIEKGQRRFFDGAANQVRIENIY